MEPRGRVHLTFRNIYTGFRWNTPIRSSTTLTLFDWNGQFGRLEEESRRVRTKLARARQRALTHAVAGNKIRTRFWLYWRRRHQTSLDKILACVRSLAVQALHGDPVKAGFGTCRRSDALLPKEVSLSDIWFVQEDLLSAIGLRFYTGPAYG